MGKILLLEPDFVLAGNMAKHFANANHKVYTHTDAQAAIAEADKHRLDIVIAELQLAGRSGIEFLYEFRSYPDWQTIPVIITGNVHERDMSLYAEVFKELNISDYFYKPTMRPEQLLESAQRSLTAMVNG